MSTSEIATKLGVSKSFLYSLVKEHPAEKPRSKSDLQAWADFVGKHRIEPIGGRMPRLS
jgi:transposase